jgi:copper homeostasis protein
VALAFEICIDSLEGAEAAIAAGADRVELCADLDVGGTTPDLGLTERVVQRAAGKLKVHVLVRARGGDFVYTADEVDGMLADITALHRAGVDGIVAGALRPDGAVDVETSTRLVEAARPASVTFHRAIDVATDVDAAFDAVRGLGVDRILTSGGAPSAPEGAPVIARFVRQAGDRPVILPGGGVTADTAGALVARTGAQELHFSGRHGEGPLAGRLRRIMEAAEAEAPGPFLKGPGATS